MGMGNPAQHYEQSVSHCGNFIENSDELVEAENTEYKKTPGKRPRFAIFLSISDESVGTKQLLYSCQMGLPESSE